MDAGHVFSTSGLMGNTETARRCLLAETVNTMVYRGLVAFPGSPTGCLSDSIDCFCAILNPAWVPMDLIKCKVQLHSPGPSTRLLGALRLAQICCAGLPQPCTRGGVATDPIGEETVDRVPRLRVNEVAVSWGNADNSYEIGVSWWACGP